MQTKYEFDVQQLTHLIEMISLLLGNLFILLHKLSKRVAKWQANNFYEMC